MRREELCRVGLRISLVSLLLLVKTFFLCGQIKWDGGAGDGAWNNPLNWAGDNLPISTDDVILDNTFVQGSYKVTMPAGNVSVSIKTVSIIPALPDSITLELPKTNTISPGLQVTGSGFPLIIKDRGTLINASGSGTGASVVVADSIKIENGGCYIHRTARAHAALVMSLSKAPGTEEGIFWFDVPDVSSTISLSNRTFGKLRLSAFSAGGSLNYTAASTQKIRVRSDLVIDVGVKLNLNCSDTFHISRDLLQVGGTLNLSSSSRLLVMAVGGRIDVAAGGLVTETGSALPVLLLNGSASQTISFEGSLTNQVVIRLNNSSGVSLQHPLNISYLFDLKKGRITTDASNLLTITAGASILADSLKLDTYVNGPIRFEGLSSNYRLVPVGGSGELRWIALKRATGSFTLSYHRADGRLIDERVVDVHHISGQEYWDVKAENGSSSADVELSFNDANQSRVTDLSSLHVARLTTNGWVDAGSQLTHGSAGGRGSVVSDLQQFSLPGASNLFTLASSDPNQNPLPLLNTVVEVQPGPHEFILQFHATGCFKVELQRREPGTEFRRIDIKQYGQHTSEDRIDSFKIAGSTVGTVYRLAYFAIDSVIRFSRELMFKSAEDLDFECRMTLYNEQLKLRLNVPGSMDISLAVYDLSGRLLLRKLLVIQKGRQLVSVPLELNRQRLIVVRLGWQRGQSSVILPVR